VKIFLLLTNWLLSMNMDGQIFHPDKSLLNPKFEGYKLHLSQETSVLQFPLINRPTQVATSGKVPFVFQEVQSRITHNHLVVHGESGRAVYVDAEYHVIFVDLGQVNNYSSWFRFLC